MEHADKLVDIVSAPVGTVLYSVVILGKSFVIGYYFLSAWVGIEIVIHVNAVNVVAAHYVRYHTAYILAVVWLSGIKEN